MDYIPRASDELVEGYETAAELAERRGDMFVAVRGEQAGKPWYQLAKYCRTMAVTRARNDDQFPGQKMAAWHRKEIPMDEGGMVAAEEMGLIAPIWESGNEGVPEWQLAAIELAMGYLTPMQRVCFEMFYGGRLSYRDIAEALNMSMNEVKRHVKRARRRFAKDVRPRLNETLGNR